MGSLTGSGSLAGLVTRHIVFFAGCAMLAQTLVVFATYRPDAPRIGTATVTREAKYLAMAYRHAVAGHTAFPSPAVEERYDLYGGGEETTGPPAYAFRLRSGGGLLFSNCRASCPDAFAENESLASPSWDKVSYKRGEFFLAGRRTVAGPEGADLIVEFATFGDPRGLSRTVVATELVSHMIWPMGLLLGFVICATLLSIRLALSPVGALAAAANAASARLPMVHLPETELPREVLRLVRAINRALEKVDYHVRSQLLFTASISHEIRTPLSIVKLELGRLSGPSASGVDRHLMKLSETVEQLTTLARIEVAADDFRHGSLYEMVKEIILRLAPSVLAEGKAMAVERDGDPHVLGSPTLLSVLTHHLLREAVACARRGTSITVRIDQPAQLTISHHGSRGDGDPDDRSSATLERTFGLKVAARVAELHNAVVTTDTTPADATSSITVSFPSSSSHGRG